MTATTVAQLIVWIIIGGLAGSLTSMFVRRQYDGFGAFLNLIIGMAGAVIGGLFFDLLNLNFGFLSQIAISFDQILAAIVGSLILLLVLGVIRVSISK